MPHRDCYGASADLIRVWREWGRDGGMVWIGQHWRCFERMALDPRHMKDASAIAVNVSPDLPSRITAIC